MKPAITVYTPTYNRAYCLHKCYNSLVNQTRKDFKWLIIDDGSQDNTNQLVESWIKEGLVNIQYYYKENGGMHTAHNAAYELIDTELNVCIDSDDLMPNDAIEKILNFWEENGDESFGGIYALDMTPNGEIIGNKFPENLKYFKGYGHRQIFHNGKKVHTVKGDKKFICLTKALKKYPPIPVFEGEKYYSLYHKQYYIEKDYKILLMNEPVCIVEYLEDGSSKNMIKQYFNNPRGFNYLRKTVMTFAPTFPLRYREAIHYVSTSCILKNNKFIQESPKKLETILAIPFGVLLYVYLVSKNYGENKTLKKEI